LNSESRSLVTTILVAVRRAPPNKNTRTLTYDSNFVVELKSQGAVKHTEDLVLPSEQVLGALPGASNRLVAGERSIRLRSS